MTAINGNGTARWQLWVSAGSAGLIVLTSLFWLNTQIVTLARETEDLKAKHEATDHRLDIVDSGVQENRQRVIRLEEHQTEIETQLRSTDQVRNLSHASDMRIQAMLWEQAFHGKSHLPTDNAYYPEIGAPPHQ